MAESRSIYDVFVCDSLKHCKEEMKRNCDPYALFMTIRCFNKWFKAKSHHIGDDKSKMYMDSEHNGITRKYLIHRIKKHK